METVDLAAIARRFLRYQEIRNLSPYTVRNHRQLFVELSRYEQDRGVALTGAGLTNPTLCDLSVWQRQEPLRKTRHGRTARNPGGLLVRPRQLRALLRWLQAEGLADPALRIRLPAAPQQVREALTGEQVGRLWRSRYLTGPSSQAAYNRALFALMLTSGLRLRWPGSRTAISPGTTASR